MKRVKWGSDDKFTQVKMIVPEDCHPSLIASKPEDQPLECASMRHSSEPNQGCIPQIRWECPLVFTLKSDWQVVAGEESEEKKTQNDRQMRVLEALYPGLSAIPSSPSVSPELEVSDYDDTQTPIIPLAPINDEETSTESAPSFESVECIVPVESNRTVNETLQALPSCLNADVYAAASLALTAMLKSNEKGSMVDTDLLIKILNDPKMFETLSELSAPNPKPDTCSSKPCSDASSISVTKKSPDSPSDISRKVVPDSSDLFIRPDRLPLQNPRILGIQTIQSPLVSSVSSENLKLNSTSDTRMYVASNTSNSVSRNPVDSTLDISRMVLPVSSSEIFRPDRFTLQSSRSLPVSPEVRTVTGYSPSQQSGNYPVIKDVNYYKSLIKLHGTEENITQEHYQVSAAEITRVSGHGQAKPCRFFNSSKGCRKGSACPFEHVSLPELQVDEFVDLNKSKRLKISAGPGGNYLSPYRFKTGF